MIEDKIKAAQTGDQAASRNQKHGKSTTKDPLVEWFALGANVMRQKSRVRKWRANHGR
jgi:hypothetical protein